MINQNLGNIKTSIFYINDYHGKTLNMERTYAASNAFDYRNKNNNTDTLKLSSGDIMLGEDVKINKAAILFQNFIKVAASAIGNHEHDLQKEIGNVLPLVNYDLLSTNLKINPRNPWARIVKSSVIKEINGNKYGIIGTTPIDLFTRTKSQSLQKDISIDNPMETVADIQTEINKLQEQGVNKIILLSHLGNTMEKYIAAYTTGLDVILGGHSHNLIFDVKEGENLFYNRLGEPVIITQAGKDGKNFGILNLEFDNRGVIKKVQNNIGYTKDFRRNMAVQYIFNKLFGTSKVFGKINSAPAEPDNYLINPNPHGYFITDCMNKDLDAEISLIQAANIRGSFASGDVDDRMIYDVLPFKNKLYKVKYCEKDIVDAVKFAAKSSFCSPDHKPGILYVSGLKYTLNRYGDVRSISFVDKNGKETPININNPRIDKFYTTIVNDYCAQGNDNFSMLNRPQNIIEKYSFDSGKCVENILSKSPNGLDIKDDGRIKFVN